MVTSHEKGTFDISGYIPIILHLIILILVPMDRAHWDLSRDPHFCLSIYENIASSVQKPVIFKGFFWGYLQIIQLHKVLVNKNNLDVSSFCSLQMLHISSIPQATIYIPTSIHLLTSLVKAIV